MQTSLWFLSFFYFCIIFLLIPFFMRAHRNQIPVCTSLSELIWSIFLFILTVGELHCWVNSWLSWMELLAQHSGKGAGLGDASCLSKGENCFCSHNSHNISPSLACSSEGHIWRGGEWFRLRHLCMSLVFLCVCVFLIYEEMKSSLGSDTANSTSGAKKGVYTLLLVHNSPRIIDVSNSLEYAPCYLSSSTQTSP